MKAKDRVFVVSPAQRLTFVALVTGLAATHAAQGQEESRGGYSLEEIIVTAQKREQVAQDVPIAITAISKDVLQANRIANVMDLSGLAPNVTVRPAAGSTGIPSFSMRGITSYGVVPGSDKQVSIYLDGVYLGSPRGSSFELPDIERIEVLRGPQGTLFGRNSTAGAINIVTRNPNREFGVRQELTAGNYEHWRTRTSIDLPEMGPITGYASFMHTQRVGDVDNTGSGVFWDRTGPDTHMGRQYSPDELGGKNVNSWFVALQFEPTDNFRTSYKFDYTKDKFTPEAQALVAVIPTTPLLGPLIQSLIASQPTPVQMSPDATRPDSVNNSWNVQGRQRNLGHNLTSEFVVSDNITLRNILAYRETFITSASQLDGMGGLVLTPQALVPYATFVAFSTNPALATAPPATQGAAIQAIAGQLAPLLGRRFETIATNAQAESEQWSDELQLNYTSEKLSGTVGVLYFDQEDRAGGPPGITNTFAFTTLPQNGVIPLANQGVSYNDGKSIAGYLQAEYEITDWFEVVAGYRWTKDEKSGQYVSGGVYVPPASDPTNRVDGTFTGLRYFPFDYEHSQSTYSLGLNFTPVEDMLLYGKFATGFVSGGSIAGIEFGPEKVRSWEAGFKADFLNSRMRTNLALYHAKYDNYQSAQSGQNIADPNNPGQNLSYLGTLIVDGSVLVAKGAELEASFLPLRGLTLTTTVGFSESEFDEVNPVLQRSVGGTRYLPTLNPKWTARVAASYETEPLFAGGRLMLQLDANWRDKQRLLANPDLATQIPALKPIEFTEADWTVNARAALREIEIGSMTAEIGLWGRNIFDSDVTQFALTFNNAFASASFVSARTYGADFIVSF